MDLQKFIDKGVEYAATRAKAAKCLVELFDKLGQIEFPAHHYHTRIGSSEWSVSSHRPPCKADDISEIFCLCIGKWGTAYTDFNSSRFWTKMSSEYENSETDALKILNDCKIKDIHDAIVRVLGVIENSMKEETGYVDRLQGIVEKV